MRKRYGPFWPVRSLLRFRVCVCVFASVCGLVSTCSGPVILTSKPTWCSPWNPPRLPRASLTRAHRSFKAPSRRLVSSPFFTGVRQNKLKCNEQARTFLNVHLKKQKKTPFWFGPSASWYINTALLTIKCTFFFFATTFVFFFFLFRKEFNFLNVGCMSFYFLPLKKKKKRVSRCFLAPLNRWTAGREASQMSCEAGNVWADGRVQRGHRADCGRPAGGWAPGHGAAAGESPRGDYRCISP